jgi:phosphoglycolate phosphatase
MIKALVTFDLDGTLLDTAPGTVRTVNRTLATLRLAPLAPQAITGCIGHGVQQLFRQILAVAVPGLQGARLEERLADALPVFFHFYGELLATPGPLYPGVASGLARLRRAGVRTAVVSNKEARLARRLLASAGIAECFDLVVGGDTLAERKPHPLPLLHCLEQFDVAPRRAAHLGDMGIDIEAARRAGIAAWVVPYGYQSRASLLQAAPDRVFASLEALADHVLDAAPLARHRPAELINTN